MRLDCFDSFTWYPKLNMIERKCSIVKYREFSTHGRGSTTNSAGNTSPFDNRKKSIVRFSISYRPCGDATKFNTKDNEIKSYPYPSTQSFKKLTSTGTSNVIKSCSSILGSRLFKSIRVILPPLPSTVLPIALSTSKHPISRTLRSSGGVDLSHWTRSLEESPPR